MKLYGFRSSKTITKIGIENLKLKKNQYISYLNTCNQDLKSWITKATRKPKTIKTSYIKIEIQDRLNQIGDYREYYF